MYSQFNPRDKNAGQIRVGLQLVGAFLVHDINPFYNGEGFSLDGLTEHQFYAAICDNMDNSSREVSATAAEVIQKTSTTRTTAHFCLLACCFSAKAND